MFHVEILSGLWIGDSEIMSKVNFIKDNHIDIILNCTDIFDFPNCDVQKIRLPLSHSQNHDNMAILQKNATTLSSFISDHLPTKNILICCCDGKCMSPLIVAIYILHYGKMNSKSIYEMLITKDPTLSLWCDLSIFT